MLKIEDLTPVAPMILIRRLPAETKFAGLLIELPDQQNFKNRRTEVVAVHRGRKFGNKVVPPTVKPGDLVELIVMDGQIFDQYRYPDYEFCHEDQILAIVEEVPA